MDNEVFDRGQCIYCGQQRILGQDMGSQDAADTEATMTCTCEAGRQARRQAKECQIISGLFPELPEVTVDFLLQMAAMIREEQLYSGTSVKVAPNVTARFKLKDGAVVVTRSEKMEHQYSICLEVLSLLLLTWLVVKAAQPTTLLLSTYLTQPFRVSGCHCHQG